MFGNQTIKECDVPRNLDLTSLRSFVTVADAGGVTRAAGLLNLTQSAVSMQLKRLEEALDVALLDRSGRGVTLTASGEQLLGYARRMLALNDEAWARLTAEDFVGEIVLGVPHDIIYPYVPTVLRRFAAEFPRMQVRLISSLTRPLKGMFARGECDVILTTEDDAGPGGEVLVRQPMVWVGAVGGVSWRQSPLPLAFCSNCGFRPGVIRATDAAGVKWRMVVESESDSPVDAAVGADLGVTVRVRGVYPPQTGEIDHKGALPDLGDTALIVYAARSEDPVQAALLDLIRATYRAGVPPEEPVRLME